MISVNALHQLLGKIATVETLPGRRVDYPAILITALKLRIAAILEVLKLRHGAVLQIHPRAGRNAMFRIVHVGLSTTKLITAVILPRPLVERHAKTGIHKQYTFTIALATTTLIQT
jgi:hypothetical protein